MWVDDVRFSNAMTLERNSLLPGAVGQIACRRAVDATNFGHADVFYFYDHIGNVQGVSSSGGSVAETYTQDAWGNVLASATTGQWVTSFAGRHLTTKEQDGDVGMYYFIKRPYSSNIGLYIQHGSPYYPHGNSPVAKGIYDGNGPFIAPVFPGDPPIFIPGPPPHKNPNDPLYPPIITPPGEKPRQFPFFPTFPFFFNCGENADANARFIEFCQPCFECEAFWIGWHYVTICTNKETSESWIVDNYVLPIVVGPIK
jgi:hypothetical protein